MAFMNKPKELIEQIWKKAAEVLASSSPVEVANLVVAAFVGVCGVVVVCQTNEIADAQLKLALAESAPQLNVKIQQSSYKEPDTYDTMEILVSNEDGYLCNADTEVKALAHVQASNGFDALLPVEGIWFAHALTGNTKGYGARVTGQKHKLPLMRCLKAVPIQQCI